MSPLICFESVEWHRSERVLRQFGLHQEISPACSYEQDLHRVDARGQHQRDWARYHAPYIALWDTLVGRIITSPPMEGLMDFHCHTPNSTGVIYVTILPPDFFFTT